ncbi:hypothetical protein BT96DRAFT_996342 [Gymnopus androsaceus JB14]|uniref:RanBD1 domain-containing protein n=1 Tax=Gymnopus androsaceus JB14 TaxID=1447944 RepID=A0A6A4HI37_9AGAR|nr:hypothetical protein BT96DRAFT_996342 [Gymnopus androsaceus JB14]
MAYASTSSPFASSSNTKKSPKTISPPSAATSTSKTTPLAADASEPSGSSTGVAGTKRTASSGFEAFASPSSPFATATGAQTKSPKLGFAARAKSPKPGSGFGAALSSPKLGSSFGGSGTFGATSKIGSGTGSGSALGSGSGLKSGLGATNLKFGFGGSTSTTNAFTAYSSSSFGSGNGTGGSSFGSSSNGLGGFGGGTDADEDGADGDDDDEPKIALSEQEVSTGEELEETIYQVRGKLFALVDGAWKERGTGLLKINVRRRDGGGARLVMRKEAVYTLLLNVTLFPGMKCSLAQDPRYVRFSVIEGTGSTNGSGTSTNGGGASEDANLNGVLGESSTAATPVTMTTHYNLRLANAKIASELMEAIHENLPSK